MNSMHADRMTVCFTILHAGNIARFTRIYNREIEMLIPEIGETITNERAIELCMHYELDEIVQRIKHSPSLFKPWVFDGASCVNDELLAEVFNLPGIEEIALQHDLAYAYGVIGDRRARKQADIKLKEDVVDDGGSEALAYTAYLLVRAGGNIPDTGYQWGFARV